jgi:hypothetical protein
MFEHPLRWLEQLQSPNTKLLIMRLLLRPLDRRLELVYCICGSGINRKLQALV